jgi:NADH:ubiquinone oxidoreductase subunit F (NADH-binding)/NADH:ubiquinone oxidoreductase subunit E
MTAIILEVRIDPAASDQVAGEYELTAGLAPEAAARGLPPAVSQALTADLEAFAALHRGLLTDQELTGIKRVRLFSQMRSATRLDMGPEAGSFTASMALPALAAGPLWGALLADLLRAQALYPGPQDTRLPRRFAPLAQAVAPLRHLLERIKQQAHQNPDLLSQLLDSLGDEDPDNPLDPLSQTRQLLARFLSREDWRERDIFHLLLDFIQGSPHLFDEMLLNTWFSLKRLQDEDPPAYTRALAALINEGRGYLGDLPRWRAVLRKYGSPGHWDLTRRDLVQRAMAGLLGLSEGDFQNLAIPEPANHLTWTRLYEAAANNAGAAHISLRSLEKASLFVAAEFFSENSGQRRFLRHLLEHEEPYRQLLATVYAPREAQEAQLARIMATFNQHPANCETQVSFTPEEAAEFLQVFFLRPDPVAAVIYREQRKDLYHTLEGLSGQALLPQVLHECQKIFRYITPEVLDRVAEGLKVAPLDILRVIASYKDFSADPAGQVIVHICKGTACFLRGQPLLSRGLAGHLGAEEGRVSPEGIQFLERDCFGVCNLAPVLKVGPTFIGQVQAREIPELIAQLLRGPSYANRTDFFRAIREALAEVDQVALHQTFRVLAALQLDVSPDLVAGLSINGLGEIRALPGNRLLGNLVDRSFSFTYRDASGTEKLAALVTDADDLLRGAVNITHPEVLTSLGQTLRPRVFLENNQVLLEGKPAPLGEYHSSSIVLKKPDGSYGCLVFDEDNLKSPPEERRGLPEVARRPPPPEFYSQQDRYLLGFVEGVNPESIDSYLEKGGYQALKKVLGYGTLTKRWQPEDIVQEIMASNLRGRGGAGFPTGLKWREMLKARPQAESKDEVRIDLKLMVANGDEGDPGAFMDRTLIQERPHQLLEGMLIAALATDCRYGVIYVRQEYEDAVARLENALFEARRYGFLGRQILGVPDFDFDVEIRLGAGAFVAGEKRAIMRAIEGKAAEPDVKAVSNIKRGLWGKPTLLNNVETFANVPLILQKGGEWFRGLGYGGSGGTKIFSVAGIVNYTGLVEVRFGRTLRDILNIAGGVQEGKVLAGVQIGGPSGAILSLTGIRAYLLDAPLDFDTFDRVGAMIGSGGLVFLGEDDDVLRLARHFTDWLTDESCGQCPACLNGLTSLGATLDRILRGEGVSLDIHLLWGKADIIRAGSNCGLGQTAPNPVTSSLRFFPVAYLHYLLDNPSIDTLELFRSLEALRLITRQEVSMGDGEPAAAVFGLKKGFITFILEELEKRERFRPGAESRPQKFLKLLDLRREEVGLKGVTREFSQEHLTQWQSLMVGDRVASGPPPGTGP